MKRIGDWLYVLGVNTLDQHLSYVTHPRRPQARPPAVVLLSRAVVGGVPRLGRATSRGSRRRCRQGEQVNRVLVLEPTTTAWMYQADPNAAQLEEIGETFFRPCHVAWSGPRWNTTSAAKTSSPGTARSKRQGRSQVGRRAATTGRPAARRPRTSTRKTDGLAGGVRAGRRPVVLCCGAGRRRWSTAGRRDRGREARRRQPAGERSTRTSARADRWPGMRGDGFAIHRAAGDKGILFHHRRQLDDGEILFLVNTSIDAPVARAPSSRRPRASSSGTCQTGRITAVSVRGRTAAASRPASTCLRAAACCCSSRRSRPRGRRGCRRHDRPPVSRPPGRLQIRRLEPNVLTLDYVDVTAGGETQKSAYFYQANQFAFQKNGMDRNPWDSAVQFKDELIRKKFPPDSGFEATYRFTIEGAVPKPLWHRHRAARPLHDHLQRQAGGRPSQGHVVARQGLRQDRHRRGRPPGENAVTLKASPFTIYHELEPAYVLGDFALRPTTAGFVDRAGPAAAEAGPGWNQQGLPVLRRRRGLSPDLRRRPAAGPVPRRPARLVRQRGQGARSTASSPATSPGQPWECDVTEPIRPGKNTVEVRGDRHAEEHARPAPRRHAASAAPGRRCSSRAPSQARRPAPRTTRSATGCSSRLCWSKSRARRLQLSAVSSQLAGWGAGPEHSGAGIPACPT